MRSSLPNRRRRRGLGAAAVRGRPDAEGGGRLRQPQEALRGAPGRQYHIEVIDLLENPQLAEGDQILAVPTLVRKLPEPVRKIIGDLSNTERVLVGLDLGRDRGEGNAWRRNTAQTDERGPGGGGQERRDDQQYVLRLYVAGMTPRSPGGDPNDHGDLRGAPQGPLRPGGDRHLPAADPGQGRADHRRADADQETAAAAAPVHRQHGRQGQGPGRAGSEGQD